MHTPGSIVCDCGPKTAPEHTATMDEKTTHTHALAFQHDDTPRPHIHEVEVGRRPHNHMQAGRVSTTSGQDMEPAGGGKPPAQPQDRREWIPTALQPTAFAAFCVLDVGLITAIGALLAVSSRQNGIASIPGSSPLSILGWDVGINILWTTLPSLVFALFASFWASMAEDSAVRQPYIELCRAGGAAAADSIFLDYRGSWSLVRWCRALQRRHWVVGTALLASLISEKGITALASSMLYPQQVPVESPVQVSTNSTFTDALLGADLDWRPVFDTVSATTIWGGSALPWTSAEYAFTPFYASDGTGLAYNLTANTTAYSAYLDCRVLDTSTYSLTVSGGKAVHMTANDRGCDVVQTFDVTDLQQAYFKTTSQTNCSYASWYSRMVFTYGIYDKDADSLLANRSVISCIPGYRATDGLVTVTIGPPGAGRNLGLGRDGTVLAFRPTQAPRDARPNAYRAIEGGLFMSTAFDSKTQWSTTDLGNVILYHARSRAAPGTPTLHEDVILPADVLAASIQTIFTSVYLTGVSFHGLGPTTAQLTTGTMAVQATRLLVLRSVAYTIIAVLAVLLGLAVTLRLYASRNRTYLTEKPEGLMSYAVLLRDSALIEEAAVARNTTSEAAVGAMQNEDLWEITSNRDGGRQGRIQRREQR